jgi:hypothetical protein
VATSGLYGNTATVSVASPSGVDSVGLYGKSAAVEVALPSGSESSGLYGNNTVFGGTYFQWTIFNTSDSLPATPTGGTWDFTANTGTPPSGWLLSPPSNPTYRVWESLAIVSSRNPTTITWSVPGKFLNNNQIYVSVTAPPAPALNDLWYDLGA